MRNLANFREAGLGPHTEVENHVVENAASYDGFLDLIDEANERLEGGLVNFG